MLIYHFVALSFAMSLPPNEIVYSPDGDISYVKLHTVVEGSLREMIYEKVCLPYMQQGTAIYCVTPRDPTMSRTYTRATISFTALPQSVQKIFQAENRTDLETLLRSPQLERFVIKP